VPTFCRATGSHGYRHREVRAGTTTTEKSKPLSKSEILNAIADAVREELSRKHVKQVVETLVTVGHKELKKSGVVEQQRDRPEPQSKQRSQWR
jgi:hypothetical protein